MTSKSARPPKMGSKEIMEHQEFLKRIKKTLYYGASSSSFQCDRISQPLAFYASELFSETHKGTSLNRLDFATVGKLKITPCSLILSMIYLERLNDLNPAYAHKVTPSELFLVSMMVSTKFYCGYDEYIYMSEWAEYGNMTVDYLKALELEFLDAMNWSIFVSDEEFFEKLSATETILARRQGLKRGWLTYTELVRLMPAFGIARQLLNASVVLALSYAAGVMTIATGFFLASQVPGTSLHTSTTKAPRDVSNDTQSTPLTPSDLDPSDPQTELGYMLEDLEESIDKYEVVNCSVLHKNKWIIPRDSRMYLNELLQSKCNYGPDVGSSTGALLANYLDDKGADAKRNETWGLLEGPPRSEPSFLFPVLWFKFI